MQEDINVVHHLHGGDPSPEKRRLISALVYEHRLVFYALTLRTLLESARKRSRGPVAGYVRTLKRPPELRAQRVPAGAEAVEGNKALFSRAWSGTVPSSERAC